MYIANQKFEHVLIQCFFFTLYINIEDIEVMTEQKYNFVVNKIREYCSTHSIILFLGVIVLLENKGWSYKVQIR